MVDVSYSVLAGADDGYCQLSGGSLIDSLTTAYFGEQFSTAYRQYWRFDNVTIPAGVNIDSAVVRLTASGTSSGTTCNAIVYFEDEDDPPAPSVVADVQGASLTTGVSWNSIGAWSNGVTYDTPDISDDLQTVIDRGGWASGQAVIVHVLDNSSSSDAYRRSAAYENSGLDEAELIVSYSNPFEIPASEDIEISESVSIEADLITQDNIELSESVDALLGFDESLPTITQDITLTESITMIRGLSGIPTQSENINLSESITALLGFDESLPEQAESIDLSEYSLVDISPTISVFESITIEETGNIRPEPFTSDQLNLSEYVLARRGYWADVDDSFTITDVFRVFHYSNWLRQNKAQSKQRFFFTLTGATDETTDTEIPASSIFARKRSGDPTYLQVTIPTFNYSVDVALRPGGEMLVDMAYEIDGEIALRERILEADLEDISTYEGPVSRSIVLTGHRTQDFGGQVVTFNRSEVIYRGYQTRARSFRFAFIDPFLNPGDTVVVGAESFTCNNIIYIINPLRTTMEVREAL